MEKLINKDNFIIYCDENHSYVDINKNPYISATQILHKIKEESNWDRIKYYMAIGELGKGSSQDAIKIVTERITKEWDYKNKLSRDYGHAVHYILECPDNYNEESVQKLSKLWERAYLLLNGVEKEWGSEENNNLYALIKKLSSIYSRYQINYSEELFYSKEYYVAGTGDKPLQRQRKSKLLDIFDYKTNIVKGISLDSIKRVNGVWTKHYDRMLLDPVSHMEDCSYNEYCLQLSQYAYMAEEHGYSIGRLGLFYIDLLFNMTVYPCPYLKYEVREIYNKFATKREELVKW
jgi:hypothetical protein